MDLRDCQEVASATHLQPFENHLVRFGNELGFGFLTGALILESLGGRVETLPFGNIPADYM